MPYKIVEQISYDPTARDLSVEVAKAKATGADALLMVSRLNDAILLTRELIKQRWSPMAVLSMGPGWYEEQYLKTLGKMSDGPLSFVPWYDPHKKLTKQLEVRSPKPIQGSTSTPITSTRSRLCLWRRTRSSAHARPTRKRSPTLSARPTSPTSELGPGIQFNERGQNDKLKNAAIQNRGGKLLTVAPKGASNAKPNGPSPPTTSAPDVTERHVMAGLVPAIHAFLIGTRTWMPGTRPGTTAERPLLAKIRYGLGRAGADRHLSQRRRRRGPHRPRLWADGARPVGDLRRGARGQFHFGEMMTIAMYIAVMLFSAFHLDPLIMLVPIAAVLFAFGYVLQKRPDQSVHHPARAQPVPAAGGDGHHHRQCAADRVRPGRANVQTSYGYDSFQIGPLIVDATKLYAGLAAIVVAAALFGFFRYTRARHRDPRLRRQLHRRASGRAQRQAALRADLRPRRRLRWRRRLMLVLIVDVTPALGPAYTLLAFVIVITGGLGSMPGALIGGVLIGLTEAMAGLLFTPSAKSMFSFAILVLVLLFRPQGIMGKRAAGEGGMIAR